MKIQCKCGRAMVVNQEEHAGRKVACRACGQRYRLPSREPRDPTLQGRVWQPDHPESQAADPKEVGAVLLGQKISFTWIFLSVIITLLITIGGTVGLKAGWTRVLAVESMQKYHEYLWLAIMWAPCLAFVISGWITARLSPGQTIAEPALGAVLSVGVLAALIVFRPGPVDAFLGPLDFDWTGSSALKANLFALAMFTAAMLSCAGAFFGEVAQERSSV